ncbi:agmatinase [Thermogutta sp.]|jgi:agmatinase|uniref:agmatinase n=1 Tax=Thermogutta sp. TaxID=1962930 RepID=UPI0032205422
MIPHELCQPNLNFLGLPEELADPTTAKVWILPVPYEATTTYGAGTRNGPMAILMASRQVELYDHRHGCEPAESLGFATLPPMEITVSTPDAMINRVAAAVETVFSQPPSPELLVILGGEHSISAGVARGLSRVMDRDSLVCVQVDAHADLRDEFEGSPFNHACAARRISEVCPLFQIGIRNISKEEAEFRPTAKNIHTFFREQWGSSGVNAVRDFVRNKTVYLTIDLDGLDSSIMPAVGTPEPGGLLWHELLEIIRTIAEAAARVPVMDVVELAPIPGMIAPDFLAAKLIYWAAADLLLTKHGTNNCG